ncbi:MAG: 16S rRNA (cytidine(1402)-2'-O)-methyltransferase [Lachnospiraceae bacterium]|nr:16S rRNA (cytidine(1402)-2'-O)-methyltransferase [Lachnospiraceae bacterium]
MAGILYLVATPIGNLEDMTFRAIRTLKEADLIACEDTRTSQPLLKHFDIGTPLTSYHKYNENEKCDWLIAELLSGKNVAVISDAGMPVISDPGSVLVKACREQGIEVTVIPGANAGLTALVMSGLDARRFIFEGFLPGDNKEKQAVLDSLKGETRTTIFYEAPHRLEKTLKTFYEALGDRPVALCRELTKKFETVRVMSLAEAISFSQAEKPRGEYVVVLGGADPEALKAEARASWEEMSVADHVALYEAQGLERKEAMKAAAKDRGVSKRDIYQALLEE